MNKSEIRTRLKKLRFELDRDIKTEKSEKIFNILLEDKTFLSAKTVMVYMSLGNEVDTQKIIEYSLTEGKNVLVPVTEDDYILPCKISSCEDFITGKFGIREPREKMVWQDEIDLVIVPGVGFSKNGGRIGFGKGYYDRFLNKRKTKKYGLAYSFQIVENAYSSEFDIPMDVIITEEGLINCG